MCADCGTTSSFVGPWQADHNIPLWKVPEKGGYVVRIWYWTLANLKTRCTKCHTIKSGKETSERDHHKRLVKVKAGKPKRSKIVRKVGGGIRDDRKKRKLPW